MKKIFSIFLIFTLLYTNFFAFSDNTLAEQNMYYVDSDNNGKIDKLEIYFNNELTWILNPDKLFLYSDTGWLSSNKLDSVSWNSIFSSFSLSWNILILNLIEQDKYLTWLSINNTTSSHLRLKTNSWVGIKDLAWNEIKLLYTSSFLNYSNVFYKANSINLDINTSTWEILLDTWSEIVLNPEITEEIDYNTWFTDSWMIENITNTWELDELEGTWIMFIFNPQITLIFQSPSYLLEKDNPDTTIFNCDDTKTDCKVNYNLLVDYTWSYICEWNFWLWKLTREENKCNPNTIVYPVWTWDTIYKVYEKSNPNNFVEKKFRIINSGYKDTSTKVVYNTVYTSSSNQNITNSEILNIKTPIINIQSWLWENNNCSKNDCSVNLSYTRQSSKESCLWDFSWWVYTWNLETCNPSYVKYPIWDFIVSLKVYEQWNPANYKVSYLYIHNKKDLVSEDLKKIETNENKFELDDSKLSDNDTSFSWLVISEALPNPVWKDDLEWIELENIWEDEISLSWCEIQNKLKSSIKKSIISDVFLSPNEKLKFYKKDTNLSIRNSSWRSLSLVCLWNEIDNMSWNFDTPEWFIVDRQDLTNWISSVEKDKKSWWLLVNFLDGSKKEILDFYETGTVLDTKSQTEIENSVKSIIELQGKLSKNKVLKWNKISCLDLDECSINFDWSSSLWGKNLEYFWDFWNGKTFTKANPSSYIFYTWKYIISLKVSSKNKSDISYFSVEVLWKEEKQVTSKIIKEKNDFVDNLEAWDNLVKEKQKDIFSNTQILISSILLVLWFILSFVVMKRRNLL